jgi:hypothetical protein
VKLCPAEIAIAFVASSIIAGWCRTSAPAFPSSLNASPKSPARRYQRFMDIIDRFDKVCLAQDKVNGPGTRSLRWSGS